jgi:hypothetical protein
MNRTPPQIARDGLHTFTVEVPRRILTAAERWSMPAPLWNRLIEFLQRNAIIVASSVSRAGTPAHPWAVHCEWAPETGLFLLTVNPGFVNGLETQVRIPGAYAGPLTVARLGREPKRTESVLARLTESPSIPVEPARWRADTSPPAGLTAQFGPAVGEATTTFTEFGLVTTQPSYDPAARAYRALSLWVAQPRPSLFIETDLDTGLTSAAITGAGGRSTLIVSGAAYAEPVEPTGLDLLAGDRDSGQDTRPIATVWLVGPEGSGNWAEAIPDGTWTPVVEQKTWWNLMHDFTRPAALRHPDLEPLLAGGLTAAETIQWFQTDKNRKDSLAISLTSARIRGYFWSV